jgi:hypothetical protein
MNCNIWSAEYKIHSMDCKMWTALYKLQSFRSALRNSTAVLLSSGSLSAPLAYGRKSAPFSGTSPLRCSVKLCCRRLKSRVTAACLGPTGGTDDWWHFYLHLHTGCSSYGSVSSNSCAVYFVILHVIGIQTTPFRDFRLPPRCWWNLASSGVWHSVEWVIPPENRHFVGLVVRHVSKERGAP